MSFRRLRFAPRPFAALAALVVLLGGGLALAPAAPAEAATRVVTTAQEFDDAIANYQLGDVIEVRNTLVASSVSAPVPLTISVVSGATVTVPSMTASGVVKLGAGVLRVADGLTVLRDVTVAAGGLVADTVITSRLAVNVGAVLDAGTVTTQDDATVGGILEADLLQILAWSVFTISGKVEARRIVGSAKTWNVSGMLETVEMRLPSSATMTITGELRLLGTFLNEGIIDNVSRITGPARVHNDGIIRGSGTITAVESITGHNYRLELVQPGATTTVRVLAPSLTLGERSMPVPGATDGAVFRAWTVGGAPITGDTSLTALGFTAICPTQPALQCGRLIVASPTWDELSFSAPPQVGVPTAATFSGSESPTLAVDGVTRAGTTLTPAPEEAGLPIRARVTMSYPSGYAFATGTAEVSATIALGDFTPGGVRIVGDARVGQQVRAEASGFVPAPDGLSFEWSTPLGPLGAGDRIVVPASALGQPLTVTATATAPGYLDEVVSSDAVVVEAAAAAAAPTDAAAPLASTGPPSPVPTLLAASALFTLGLVLLRARRRLASR